MPCIVSWDKQFWPNDLNWASIFKSCAGSEQANSGWCIRLDGSDCFVACISATAAQQFLDNIKYYLSQRRCWSLMSGDHQSAGGVSFAHCRDPSQTSKWSISFVCFWTAQSFLLDLALKEGELCLGTKVLGAKERAREHCRYLEVKIAVPADSCALLRRAQGAKIAEAQ